MKNLILAFATLLTCASAFASTAAVDLKDQSILGRYILRPATKHSEIQWAELRYNADQKLVLVWNRNDGELELLDAAKADGTVIDFQDEPNCDGDEEHCTFDSQVTVRLVEGTKGHPNMQIELTIEDAFNEDNDTNSTTETFELVWKKALPDAIPFFVNVALPDHLKTLVDNCTAVVKPTVGHGVSNASKICSSVKSVLYRESLEETLPYYLKDQASQPVKEIKSQKLESVLALHEQAIKKLDAKDLKVSKTVLLNEARGLHEFIRQADHVYYEKWAYYAVIFAIDEQNHLIHKFMIDVGM